MKDFNINIYSYESGVIAMLSLMLRYDMSKQDLEDTLHDHVERFKTRYGIEHYDVLEACLDG